MYIAASRLGKYLSLATSVSEINQHKWMNEWIILWIQKLINKEIKDAVIPDLWTLYWLRCTFF